MIRVTKELKFCAAHRLLNYYGACANIHGHNYKVFITIEGTSLDDLGMLIDFSVIKASMQQFLDDKFDHCIMVNSKDTSLLAALQQLQPATKMHVFEKDNATAEVIAEYLHVAFTRLLDTLNSIGVHGLHISSVSVYETDTSRAEWSC